MFYHFGDISWRAEEREALYRRALEGSVTEAEAVDTGLAAVERWDRVLRWFVDVGERFPAHHDALARALVASALVESTLVRLLDVPLDAFVAHVVVDPDALACWARVTGQSTVTGRFLAQAPTMACADARARALQSLDAEIAALCAASTEHSVAHDTTRLGALLRRRRRLRYVGIVDLEVSHARGIEETSALIAGCAVEALRDALLYAERVHRGAWLRMVILGMGKLGGDELNLSSDVDIVFVTDPEQARADEDSVAREVVRTVSTLLDEWTEEGIVFRVDLRLRPFGTQGQPAMRRTTTLAYLEAHGREWERGAWVKAWPVAGALDVGHRLVREAEAFVFRRYLDEGALRDVAAMKDAVVQDLRRRSVGSAGEIDVKLGAGGIRDIEFFVQVFQLIYGGRQPLLRARSTLQALSRLTEAGLLPESERQELTAAYRWLRVLEHRIQMDEELQTHRVPAPGASRDRLAWRMGYADGASLIAHQHAYATIVSAAFERLLEGFGRPRRVVAWLESALDATDEGEAVTAVATLAPSFSNARRVAREVRRLGEGTAALLGDRAEPANVSTVSELLDLCARSTFPDRSFDRVMDVLRSRSGRHSLLRILARRPRAATVVVTLFAASDYLARTMTRDPGLIETLLSDAATSVLDTQGLSVRLSQTLGDLRAPVDGATRERRLHAMRRFRHGEEVRVAMAYISESIGLKEATLRLSELAEVMLAATLAEASADVDPDVAWADRVAVVLMGKLGGMELGHGGDVDALFVYDGEPREVGEFARRVRRWITFVTAPMVHGRLYTVDTRLRPDGAQGTMVTSVDAFERYYRERAMAWERMALIRARSYTPNASLQGQLDDVVESLIDTVTPDDLRADFRDLRGKRARERDGSVEDDFKNADGGLADLEFALHFAQVLARYEGRWTGGRVGRSWDAPVRLAAAGVLSDPQAMSLEESLMFFRRVETWVRLSEGEAHDRLPPPGLRREAVAQRVMSGNGAVATTLHGASLMDAMGVHRGRVLKTLETLGLHQV